MKQGMKLGGFAVTVAANGFSGKGFCDSPSMPTGAMAPPRLSSPSVLPRSGGRILYTTAGLSLGLSNDLEQQHESSRTAENDPAKAKEEYESRSGSDNMDGGSADEQDPELNRAAKKRYHRHNATQIQEMEAAFKECPHPDEKQRQNLSKRLNLSTRQVKFWFQNRRTQMKAQQERHDNNVLRQENERLRAENITLREAIRNASCPTCGGPTAIEMSIEEQQLRFENVRMRDELERLYAMNGKPYNARHLSSPVSFSLMSCPSSELTTASNLSVLQSVSSRDLMQGSSITEMPLRSCLLSDIEKDMITELAIVAMEELLKMIHAGEPLWMPSPETGKETLDFNEYLRQFPRGIGPKPIGYRSEATRDSGVVIMNGLSIVDAFLDVSRWMEMFPCTITRADVAEVISGGANFTRDGALQLMYAELQVLSPFVSAREVYFLRFCKMLREGAWAIVDVSVDNLRGNAPSSINRARKRPSGCLIQELPNGYSKVSWVEHSEYNDSELHRLYRPLVTSGMAFGAQRWLSTLQRQSERLVSLLATNVGGREPGGIPTPEGRRSMLKLAQRMTTNFCSSVSVSTVHNWTTLSGSKDGDEVRVMTRKSIDNPSDPSGIVLSAATSVWLPVAPQRLFEFLRNEHLRKEWDILSMGGPMEEMIHIAKGQDPGNSVSLLRASDAGASNMLIIQECCTDSSGSLVVYAPVDVANMNAVMSGKDPSFVTVLPSGFVILPDGPECRPLGLLDEGDRGFESPRIGGSLLTVAFQILVNTMPGSRFTLESINTVNSLVSSTVQKIKHALGCEDA